MAWIKRNLFLVVFGVIALGLMGFAGYFLYDNIQKNDEVKLRLLSQVQSLTDLSISDPFPNPTNIAAIKLDQGRVQQLLKESRKAFTVGQEPPKLDDRGFKLLLEKTIAELVQGASNAGVGLPSDKYSFGFRAQREVLQYKPGSLEPWSVQLGEIKDICEVLFRAKVMAFQGVRRAPIFPFDTAGADIMGMFTATNSFATYFPYEITFRGFSADLAAVLEGFQKANTCYVVKYINIDPSQIGIPAYVVPTAAAAAATAPAVAPSGTPSAPARPKTAAEEFAARYGNSAPPPVSKAGAPKPVAVRAATPTATPSQLTTVLSERPLRIAMLVVVVKLKADKDKK